MTGYPSVPNAVSAIRLGAAGYVTKPFTPEEIARPSTSTCAAEPVALDADSSLADDAWTPGAEGHLFLARMPGSSTGRTGRLAPGVLTPRTQAASIRAVRLPRIGEVVYQGLPLAVDRPRRPAPQTVVAPLSGVVVGRQRTLDRGSRRRSGPIPAAPAGSPRSAPRGIDEETEQCRRRRVILLNADAAAPPAQQAKLAALGCEVRVASATGKNSRSPLQDNGFGAVLVDAASFGQDGPALVEQINAAAPAMKIVLLGPATRRWKPPIASDRIFYYAVEPFADNEIADILAGRLPHARCRPPTKHATPQDRRAASAAS